MKSSSFCKLRAAWAATAVLLAASAAGQQFKGFQAASVIPPQAVELKAGEELVVPLKVLIRPGYHINSNAPAEDYLIPTRLTWTVDGLKVKTVDYPKPETVTYEFSEKPLSVFSGTVTVRTTFAGADSLPHDLKELTGKLRYQACNEKACLPPVTADVKVQVQVQ